MEDELRKRRGSAPKKIRTAKIVSEAMAGKSATEIAKDMGVQRQTVSRILNSEEAARLIDEAGSQVTHMAIDALETVKDAMSKRDLDMTNALKAAMSVLVTLGVLKNKSEVSTKVDPDTQRLLEEIKRIEALPREEQIRLAEEALGKERGNV